MDLLFPLLIVFMIGMIFFSNRQRKKQQQQQENLQNAIQVGDVVLMTSGISGTVVDVDDERTIDLEIAPEVITTWLRAAVREKLSTETDHAADALEADDVDAVEPAAEPTPSTTVQAPATATTTSTGTEPKDAPRGDDLSDPTAAPTTNGVSAGSKESRNN
ncbi:preprotein translocase subunit YajC [Actinomycetospora termitidis]|uniref:Preprotein translocase subunit YajC n=1 Tax=Actinomycetospora termitidis TaxID=3053470 RepID=A0ABT7MDB9_9PSEU|nr:preprotein translocase subunit YajC [Actinomycetospora sp. Odt1-22]MDL5158664.1 preprotein translocase subunit YajC [Actinomycetospora sp. Odt1-22]